MIFFTSNATVKNLEERPVIHLHFKLAGCIFTFRADFKTFRGRPNA